MMFKRKVSTGAFLKCGRTELVLVWFFRYVSGLGSLDTGRWLVIIADVHVEYTAAGREFD